MASYPTSVNPFGVIAPSGTARSSMYSERTAVVTLINELGAVLVDLVAARGASVSVATRLTAVDAAVTAGNAASVATAATDATTKANAAQAAAATDATTKANAAQAAAVAAAATDATTKANAAQAAAIAAAIAAASALSGRNVVLNGSNVVRQRGNGPFTVGGFTVDGMYLNISGSTATHTMDAHAPGAIPGVKESGHHNKTIVTSVAGTGNFVNNRYIIEDASTLAGKVCTVSIYAKADAARPIAIELTQMFGTGGSPSPEVSAIGVYKPTLTTGWARYTYTFTMPSVSGKTFGSNNNSNLSINVWMDAGSSINARTSSLGQQSGTFFTDMVQLEAGSTATPFEFENPAITLTKCQRYVRTLRGTDFHGSASSTTDAFLRAYFPDMRAAPTLSLNAGPYTSWLKERGVGGFKTPSSLSLSYANPGLIEIIAVTTGMTVPNAVSLEGAGNGGYLTAELF